MAKHALRIIVTVVLLIALGYVAFDYFYTPNDDEVVYASVGDFIELIDSQDSVNNNLSSLSNDYFGVSRAVGDIITDDNMPKVLALHELIFGAQTNNAFYRYYGDTISSRYSVSSVRAELGYEDALDMLDEVMKHYYKLSQYSSGATAYGYNKVTNAIDNLEDKNKELNNTLKMAYDFKSSNENTSDSTQQQALYNYYMTTVQGIREYVYYYANAITEVKDYVETYVYDNNYIYDNNAIFYHAMTLNLAKFASITLDNEGLDQAMELIESSNILLDQATMERNAYLYDAYVISITKDAMQAFEDEEIVADNWNAINSFLTLQNNYKAILYGQNNMFQLSNSDKESIAKENESQVLSSINAQYVDEVSYLMSYIGFYNI